MRLVWIIVGMAVAIIIPFAVWGNWWETTFSLTGVRDWLHSLGAWGWLAGVGLLISDLFLPVPGTVVMSGMGWLYGWLAGGLAASAGSFLAGGAAYLACHSLGERAAVRILGKADLAKGKELMQRHGAWIIAISRALPILPEITTCLAGLTRMPLRQFLPALGAGSLTTGFLYAGVGAMGAAGEAYATPTFLLSLLLPVALYLAARRMV